MERIEILGDEMDENFKTLNENKDELEYRVKELEQMKVKLEELDRHSN